MKYPELYTEKHFLSSSNEWVVFVHGAGGSTRTWRRQIEDFSAGYNLLLIDLPDHGASSEIPNTTEEYSFEWLADTIWKAVDDAGIQTAHLCGLSLGSILVMEMERRQPVRVESMVLGGAIVRLDRKLKVIARTSLSLARLIGFRAFYRLAARIALPRKNHKRSRSVFVRESRALTIAAFERWTRMYTGLDAHLEELFTYVTDTPRHLLMGSQDHLFGRTAQDYSEVHEHASLQVVDGCGHVVSIERPELFNQHALEFLQSLLPSPLMTSSEAASLVS